MVYNYVWFKIHSQICLYILANIIVTNCTINLDMISKILLFMTWWPRVFLGRMYSMHLDISKNDIKDMTFYDKRAGGLMAQSLPGSITQTIIHHLLSHTICALIFSYSLSEFDIPYMFSLIFHNTFFLNWKNLYGKNYYNFNVWSHLKSVNGPLIWI